MEFNSERALALVSQSRFKRSAIAEDCCITEESLSHYLNGHGRPSKAVVKLLAQTLDVPESELWIAQDKAKAS